MVETHILDMSNKQLTLYEAEAILIKSMSNLVWIMALAIIVGAWLTFAGYTIDTTMITSVKQIIISSLWVLVIFKILRIAENYLERQDTSK